MLPAREFDLPLGEIADDVVASERHQLSRMAHIQVSSTFASLSSRLASNTEEEDDITCAVPGFSNRFRVLRVLAGRLKFTVRRHRFNLLVLRNFQVLRVRVSDTLESDTRLW